MNVLGIGGSIHDFSSCLSQHGKILTYIEEERLLRMKHSLNIHKKIVLNKAAEYCLSVNNMNEEDLDCIVTSDIVEPAYYSRFNHHHVHQINHHLSHAATTFYPSPFNESAILIVDGRGSFLSNGERETISYYYGKGRDIIELKKVSGLEENDLIENSVGKFYEEMTDLIGFGFLQDGKTMGLAPFGTEKYIKDFTEFFWFDHKGQFKQSLLQIQKMREFVRHQMKNSQDKQQTKADMAYAVQHHLEEVLIAACINLYSITKSENLCLSGGVALNGVANEKILRRTPFKNLYIFPAAGDAGTAVGCSLYGYYQIGGYERIPNTGDCSPYLGKEYSDSDIKSAFHKHASNLTIVQHTEDDLYDEVSTLLSEGKIIGWFQGKSEAGPRALGNRSILADPRNPNMKDIINKRIKHREPFRPFAPAVLEEYARDFFDFSKSSPYMLFVPKIKVNAQDKISAVTHVDGTGRLQTVSIALNPQFYELIRYFYNKTNIPILLNTSFNDNGQPIVESPQDALDSFLRMDLDYLVIGNYLLQKIESVGNGYE
ncbi:carbamoyltransferase family protein [Oceanobacillus profundus]|uniref:carbamoyltransferase family protein n=1 Tax=Oceanobacillus profundus TaxID=372463 RepID=UPI003636C62F